MIITTILFSGIGFYLNYFYIENTYETTASVYVLWEDEESSSNLYTTMLTSEMIANDLIDYISSEKIVSAALIKLSESYGIIDTGTATELVSRLSASVKTGSRNVTIKIDGYDPGLITDFLNALVESLISETNSLYSSNVIQVMSQAIVPVDPVSPQPARDTALMGAGGLIAGIVIILLIYYFESQTKKELENIQSEVNHYSTVGKSIKSNEPMDNKSYAREIEEAAALARLRNPE